MLKYVLDLCLWIMSHFRLNFSLAIVFFFSVLSAPFVVVVGLVVALLDDELETLACESRGEKKTKQKEKAKKWNNVKLSIH